MRAETRALHDRLEQRLDAVAQLSDAEQRAAMIRRYAAFHLPADAALAPVLERLDGLDFPERSRAPFLARFAGPASLPDFPAPAGCAEGLGMLYVLEGSTLGGRTILRALAERGIDDPDLAFLDPYGPQTGARWRGFLAVLARETREETPLIAEACRGAVRAFAHAERVLCGGGAA